MVGAHLKITRQFKLVPQQFLQNTHSHCSGTSEEPFKSESLVVSVFAWSLSLQRPLNRRHIAAAGCGGVEIGRARHVLDGQRDVLIGSTDKRRQLDQMLVEQLNSTRRPICCRKKALLSLQRLGVITRSVHSFIARPTLPFHPFRSNINKHNHPPTHLSSFARKTVCRSRRDV